MKYFLMFLTFIAAHLICGWVAWAGGMDFTTRGTGLQTFAFVSVCIGAYAAFGVSMFYKEKP